MDKLGHTDKNNAMFRLLRTLSRLGLGNKLTVQEEIRIAQRYSQKSTPSLSGGPCGPSIIRNFTCTRTSKS